MIWYLYPCSTTNAYRPTLIVIPKELQRLRPGRKPPGIEMR
jgi:hypothetical protein